MLNQSAEFHIMLGEKTNYGQGIGSFAIANILYHAFYNLNLNRIELTVLPYNKRAIRLYEKMGFKKEGIKRMAIYKRGHFVDTLEYSILRGEFDEQMNKGKYKDFGIEACSKD
jgi:RimJ/RimL family protein N-acetyltransferase